MKGFTLFTLGLLMAASLHAQRPISEGIGSYVKSTEQKAMECYGRGIRAKKKADAETNPEKQAKLYEKALDELTKSVNYHPNYDGYLALGQLYMAIGNQKSSIIACTHALGLKPKSGEAKSCIQAAEEMTAEAPAPAQEGDSGN